MPRPLTALALALVLTLAVPSIHSQSAAAQTTDAEAKSSPLAALDPLTGPTWLAHGDGFISTLAYNWSLDGNILEVANELADVEGNVFLRYEGAYMWDPGAGEITFYTVSGGGELHKGRAWLNDNVLWHEAEISGGGGGGYASAMRMGDNRFEFFMITGTTKAGPELFDETPLVYGRK